MDSHLLRPVLPPQRPHTGQAARVRRPGPAPGTLTSQSAISAQWDPNAGHQVRGEQGDSPGKEFTGNTWKGSPLGGLMRRGVSWAPGGRGGSARVRGTAEARTPRTPRHERTTSGASATRGEGSCANQATLDFPSPLPKGRPGHPESQPGPAQEHRAEHFRFRN